MNFNEKTTAFIAAEGAYSMMHALMKDVSIAMEHVRNGGLGDYSGRRSASLHFTRVCIYGMGEVGRQFLELIRPYKSEIYVYDDSLVAVSDGVIKVDSLEELFSKAQIMIITADLNEKTENSVTKELLALLTDGAIIVNAVSNKIIDMDSLLPELSSGRLRFGTNDSAPVAWTEKGSEIRKLKNVLLMEGLATAENW